MADIEWGCIQQSVHIPIGGMAYF